MTQIVLEQEFQTNLKVTRIGRGLLGDLSECSSIRSKVQAARLTDLCPVGMIDEVVGICGELEPSSFVDVKHLLEIEISVLKAGPVDGVADALLQVEGSCRRLGVDGRAIRVCCGEVVVGALPGVSGELLLDLRGSVYHPELTLGSATKAAEF